MKKLFIIFSLVILYYGNLIAGVKPYQPTWESVNRHNAGGTAPDWIRDGKFGFYFTWGAYSVPAFRKKGFGEWYGKWMNDESTGQNKHHKEKYGDPTDWPYHFFINGARDKAGNWVKFEPKLKSRGGKWDPDEWAQLFADAGARFAGPMAEHHDGYSMWHSKKNEWNTYDKIGLDIVGEMIKAIRKKGLKIVTTFHHAYPVIWKWWPEHNPDYWPIKCRTDGDLNLQKLYGKLPLEQGLQLWLDKLEEVIDAYQPDFIYHDVGLAPIPEKYRLNHLAYYYNKATEWGKDVMVTYKLDGEYNYDCAVLDFEGGSTHDIANYSWVCDQNLGPGTWSYVEGMTYYSANTVLHSLITIVSKNGALMLNLSPKADGTIPQEQQAIVKKVGQWLKTFGECIYNTRPWAIYGEGPSHSAHGARECTAQDIRFTRNKANTTLYAIVCGWPGNNVKVNIASLKKDNINLNTLSKVELLDKKKGSSIKLDWKQESTGLNVFMPTDKPYDMGAYPIRLVFKGKIPATPVLTMQPVFVVEDTGSGVQIEQKKKKRKRIDVKLEEGEYTSTMLKKAGIKDNKVQSVKVNAGWTVILYTNDNFTGKSMTCTRFVRNISYPGYNFGKKVLSIKVIKDKAMGE